MNKLHCAVASLMLAGAMMVGAEAAYADGAESSAYNWSGFYVGVSAGGAWADHDVRHTPTGAWIGDPDVPFYVEHGSGNLSSTGFAGGAQAGFNWQSGNIVFGLEADINWVDGAASHSETANVGNNVTFTTEADSNWVGTVRGRLGFATRSMLVYGTGGLAYGDHSISQSLLFISSEAVGSKSETSTGWVAGGGVELASNGGWSVRGEYLHIDLGTVSAELFNATFPTFTHEVDADLQIDTVRVGINYRFGSTE